MIKKKWQKYVPFLSLWPPTKSGPENGPESGPENDIQNKFEKKKDKKLSSSIIYG